MSHEISIRRPAKGAMGLSVAACSCGDYLSKPGPKETVQRAGDAHAAGARDTAEAIAPKVNTCPCVHCDGFRDRPHCAHCVGYHCKGTCLAAAGCVHAAFATR